MLTTLTDGPMTEPQVDPTLAPCPFCGKAMERYPEHAPSHFFHPGTVTGGNCVLDGKGFLNEEAERWNGRWQPADLLLRVERAIFDPGSLVGLRGDRALSRWQADAVASIITRSSSHGSFDPHIHVPGLWRCAKCSFTLIQSNLNAADGTVTPRDEPGDKCPNCDSPLWRMTWREDAQDLAARLAVEIPSGARLREALKTASEMLDIVVTQLRSWGVDPVCNVDFAQELTRGALGGGSNAPR